MALEVENALFDASLNVKTKCWGRWNDMDLEMEYPGLIGRGYHQPLGVKERRPLLRGAEDEEPAAAEEAGHETPAIPGRNRNPSALPSVPTSRFSVSKATATYVESQLLMDGSAHGGDGPFHFSRGGLHPEEQQRDPAEGSASAEALDSLLDLPAVLPARGADPAFGSRTSRPFHRHFDREHKGGMLLPSHSSTPKHWSSTRDAHLGATVPASPRTSISFQHLEDIDLKQPGKVRSKSFCTAAAARSSAPLSLHNRLNLKGSGVAGIAKPTPLDSSPLGAQIRKMSPFQADYWACAIPDCLPPSPDRQSPHWDPNKEYEDLLDYTYPLRPRHKLAPNPNDSLVHDSGVDLDSLSLSPESSLRFLTVHEQEQETAGVQSTQRCSVPLLKRAERSAPVSRYRTSPVGKVSFVDGEPLAGEIGSSGMMTHSLSPRGPSPGPSGTTSLDGGDWNSRGHGCLLERDAASSNFIRSTRVLPLQVDCSEDEEYLCLPPRLKELAMLAQQLNDLSLTMTQPEPQHVQDDVPSLSGKRSPPPSKVHGQGGRDKSRWESCCNSSPASCFQKHTEENILNKKGCKDHDSMLREDQPSRDLEFPERGIHPVHQEKGSYRDSLAQHIKVFCGQLEELICWLHRVAEVTDNWIPPRPDIESVKTSLHDYLEFKKDLAGHQALTEGVLQDGERLLECMASDSPVLQKALGLIAKHSNELENRAEHLYESIVAAMDAVGAGLTKNRDARQIASAESSK